MGLGACDGGLGTSGASEGIALEVRATILIAAASVDTRSEAATESTEGEPCPRAMERFITRLSEAATLDASSGMDPSPADWGEKAPSS